MKSNHYNYLLKDIGLFATLVGVIAATIIALYMYDLSNNVFSDIANQLYNRLVG